MTKRYIKPRKPGEKCEFAKLTDKDVNRIRLLYKSGTKVPLLAESFSISERSIYRIVKRHTWKHLPDPIVPDTYNSKS